MLFVRTVVFGFYAAWSLAAAPLFVNGAPSQASGNEMTAYIQADNFTLDSESTLTGVRFWAFSFDDLGRGYLGNVAWSIYNDSDNQPGNMLNTGAVTPVVSAGASNCCDGIAFQMDFSLPSVHLIAGTYWLGLHNGPASETGTEYFYWQTSDDNETTRGYEQLSSFGGNAWTSNNLEHAFELEGSAQSVEPVPEPSTWVLAALGLVAGVTRRQRRL
jgi:hypothetical protein